MKISLSYDNQWYTGWQQHGKIHINTATSGDIFDILTCEDIVFDQSQAGILSLKFLPLIVVW